MRSAVSPGTTNPLDPYLLVSQYRRRGRGGAMGTPEDAIAIVERFGAAWAAHDLEAALGMLTADCVFDATGPAPDGAVSKGADEIRAAWKPIFDDAGSRFEAE